LSYIQIAIALSIASMFELIISNKRIKLLTLILMSLFLVVITGLRKWGGTDLDNYRRFYENIDSSTISYGILYEALNHLSLFLNLNFEQFLFALSIVVILPQAYFFNKFCRYPSTALFVFYALNFIWLNHILIRQSIASIFILIGASMYVSGKITSSTISVAIASLFHASALLFSTMTALLIYYVNIRMVLIVTIILVSISSFNLLGELIYSLPFISPNIARYLTENEGVPVSSLLETFIAILLFYKTRRHYLPREQSLFIAILDCSVIILFLSYFVPASARFLEYSKLFFVIIILRYLESKPAKFRFILSLPIFFYGILKVYYFVQIFDGGVLLNDNTN
jgi:hypothetical protein